MSDVQIAVIDQQDTQIVLAVPGVQGATGSEIPAGGTADRVLRKNSNTDYDTNWSQVTSAMIANGAIVDEDINNGAAIAGTKISPNFGGQAVTTTGQVNAARVNVTGNTAPTNGLYLPGTNQVAISTNGTGRLFVDSSGMLGINTTAGAGDKLNIFNESYTENVAVIYGLNQTNEYLGLGVIENAAVITAGGAGSNSNSLVFRTAVSGTETERLFITSNGELKHLGGGSEGSPAVYFAGSAPSNSLYVEATTGHVGIGTAGPTSAIEAKASSAGGTIYTATSSNGGNYGGNGTYPILAFRHGYWSSARIVAGLYCDATSSSAGSGSGSGDLLFYTGSSGNGDSGSTATERARIDSSGNFYVVGAGTGGVNYAASFSGSAPVDSLNLDSSGRLLVGTSTGSGNELFIVKGDLSSPDAEAQISLRRGGVISASDRTLGQINFQAANGDYKGAWIRARSESSWSLGTSHPTRLEFSVTADGAPSPTERMRITKEGNHIYFGDSGQTVVWVNTANAANTSGILFRGRYGATSNVTGGTDCYYVFANGDVKNTNGIYTTITSDERFKQDIVEIGSQWDDIKGISLKKFRYKNDPTGELQLGVIAQELQQVCPGLVTTRTATEEDVDASGGLVAEGDEVLGWKMSILPLKAVKALQEAMERIETLEAKVAALET